MTLDYHVKGSTVGIKEPVPALENLRRFEEARELVEKYPSPGKWYLPGNKTVWEYVQGNKKQF